MDWNSDFKSTTRGLTTHFRQIYFQVQSTKRVPFGAGLCSWESAKYFAEHIAEEANNDDLEIGPVKQSRSLVFPQTTTYRLRTIARAD